MRCQLVYHQRLWGACHAWQSQNWLTDTSGCVLGGIACIVRNADDCSLLLANMCIQMYALCTVKSCTISATYIPFGLRAMLAEGMLTMDSQEGSREMDYPV